MFNKWEFPKDTTSYRSVAMAWVMWLIMLLLVPTIWGIDVLLPSATNLRRLCFYTCLSFCPQGGSALVHAGKEAPPRKEAPPPREGSTPPGRRLPLRTVRILLECILVYLDFHQLGMNKVSVWTARTFCSNWPTCFRLNKSRIVCCPCLTLT